MALFLVNLPFVHQTLIDREVASKGREVSAEVLDGRTIRGRHFVDYRLPEDVDPARTRYSARLDDETYAAAKDSRLLTVLVVPGDPSANRPAGQVPSRLFAVVALTADVVLVLGAVLYWRRRRRWRLHEVLEVHEDTVRLRFGDLTVTASAPHAWALRIRAGQQVPGSLHLVAERDVLPGRALEALEQVAGSAYVVRGRVLAARAGRVDLDVGHGLVLAVETGPHRIRADLRDTAQVSGTLCFTPS